MNKLHTNPPAMTFPVTSSSDPSALSSIAGRHPDPAGRLIVLLTKPEVNILLAARRVWELASALGCHVQFLGLCRDAAQEPSLRRQLIAISAMVQDGYLFTDVKVEHGKNWLELVRSTWQAGDVLACIAEQHTGLMHKPLSQILEANLGTSVYVLSGLDQSDRPRSNWLSGLAAWTGSIAFILGFFWLQVKITQMPRDWAHSSLLYLSLFVEVVLIWRWNSLFS